MRFGLGNVEPGMTKEPNRPLVARIDVVHQLGKGLPHARNVRTRQSDKRTLLLLNEVSAQHPRHTQATEKIDRNDSEHRHQAPILVNRRPAVERVLDARMNACKHVGVAGGRFYLCTVRCAKVGRQVLAVAGPWVNQINST